MEVVLEIILKYWIQFACGLVAALLAIFRKKVIEVYNTLKQARQNEKDKKQQEFVDQIKEQIQEGYKRSQADDEILQKQIDVVNEEMKVLKDGILSMQGRELRQECRRLLDTKHDITLKEWEHITKDHKVYNELGGNDDGDALYQLVDLKYKNSLGK